MESPLDRLREALAREFEFEREVGGGALGVLWLVRERALDRHVVLKAPRDGTPGSSSWARFLREARLLARLDDPRVVRVHRAGEAGGVPYCVLEHLEGPDLAARLTQGPLGVRELSRLARDLLGGLAAIHAAGIVHRDIKPANILWLADRAVLVDFGLARAADPDEPDITGAGTGVGTPGYLAPEQFVQADVTPSADLYAAAAVLYEAATGRRWKGAPDPRTADWGGVPRGLRRPLARGLAWAPERRWPDSGAFLRAFRRATAARFLIRAGLVALTALAAAVIWTPQPRIAEPTADLALVGFTGCGGDDSAAVALQSYVTRHLDWYPEWRVGKAPGPGGWRLHVQLDCVVSPAALASIQDPAGRVAHRFSVSAGGEPVLVAAAIADSTVARLWPAALDEFRHLGGPGRHSPEATRQYFAGEEAFHRDDWLAAEDRYQAALAADSSFQLARWRLMLVRQWRRVRFEDEEASLLRDPGDLPPLQRELLQVATLPDVRERIERYRRLASAYPRDSYAALTYANEVFVRGPLVGIPLDSGLALMREVESRHPGRNLAPALDHQAWGAIRLGNRSWAKDAVDRRVRLPSAGGLAPFFQLAYWERFHPRLAPALRWWIFREVSPEDLRLIARLHRLALTFDLPDGQAELATLVLARTNVRPLRASALEGLGLARMTGGRLSEALAAFDSAAVLREDGERSRVTVWCLVTYALGGPTLPEPHQRRCEAELRATGSDNPRAAERWGIAALAAGAGGDSGTVSILLARFDSLPPGEGGRRWRSLLEAERLALRGDFRGALEYSEPVVAYDSAGVIGGPFLRSAAHLRRAKWREAVGERARAEEELAWYQNTDFRGWPAAGAQAGEVDAVFGSVARLEQARLALARGEVDACGLVKRVAWLWRDAEPSPGKDHILAPLLLRCR